MRDFKKEGASEVALSNQKPEVGGQGSSKAKGRSRLENRRAKYDFF
jgi:hypothetical protein